MKNQTPWQCGHIPPYRLCDVGHRWIDPTQGQRKEKKFGLIP
ncbi:hypothetical protein [Synechocystis salina]|nr:hypothetical protein [Synechocystis salina]